MSLGNSELAFFPPLYNSLNLSSACLVTHFLCHKNDACCYFVNLMTSAGKLLLDELPGSASSFWSTGVVFLMDDSA